MGEGLIRCLALLSIMLLLIIGLWIIRKKRFRALKTLWFDMKYMYMRCACHIFNFIVRNGMKELFSLIEGIRNCVKYLHSSTARLD